MPINNRFVLLPNSIYLSKEGLHYRDLLTYISIRSFNNSDTDLCLPSLETVADISGMGKKCIIKSIKRLELSGHLIVDRSPKKRGSNKYTFKKTQAFFQIPYGVFDAVDLTPIQKAMLVALRQCFNSNSLESAYDLITICQLLNISYRALYPQFRALVNTGYIEVSFKVYRSGKVSKHRIIRLTDKVNWVYKRKEVKNPYKDNGIGDGFILIA